MRYFIFLFVVCILTLRTYGVADSVTPSTQRDTSAVEVVCSSTECYTIIKELGRGAFGRVCAVEDSKGRKFALKTYIIDHMEWFAGHIYNDIEREFMRGQQLEHPNIIKSYDFFTSSAEKKEMRSHLVLELVEGRTLYETDQASFSSQEALTHADQFCNALYYAFSQGLMHIDLHPGNIMLSNASEIKIIDLASFASFEEIRRFAADVQENAAEAGAAVVNTSNTLIMPEAYGLNVKTAALKQLKLKRFFLRHPHLLSKFRRFFADQNVRFAASPADRLEEIPTVQSEKTIFDEMFIYCVTNICVDIVLKSDFSPDVKDHLCAEIKKIALNHTEDVAEHKESSVDHYLYRVIDILEHFQSK